MVPFPMLPTTSTAERRLYEAFLAQLDDDYIVYHSVDWILAPQRPGGAPEQGEADFVVAHPDDGVLVLEAKGGELTYDPQTSRWIQAGHGGRHSLDEDPFHQARDELAALTRILEAQPGWEQWRPSLGYGVAFPDSRYVEAARPDAPPEVAIDRDDIGRLAARVAEIMRHWRRPDRHFGRTGAEALDRALGFRGEMRLSVDLRFGEEDRKIFELTDEQAYVLAYVKKRRRATIVGPAGSGKTVLAAQLARSIAAGGIRTLLTCVSSQVGAYLRESLAGQPHLEVTEWAALVRQEAGEPPYDAIVVDEGHRFAPAWWPALMRLHRDPNGGYLFVFADSGADRAEVGLPGLSLDVPLRTDLRTSKPIHEFVSVFHGGETLPGAGNAGGAPVEVLSYRGRTELVRLLARVLRNLEQDGTALEDVVVLTPKDAELLETGSIDGYRLARESVPGLVMTCSVDDFQGMERPVVILAGIDEHDPTRLARDLYTGGSRAVDHLIVLAQSTVAKKVRALVAETSADR